MHTDAHKYQNYRSPKDPKRVKNLHRSVTVRGLGLDDGFMLFFVERTKMGAIICARLVSYTGHWWLAAHELRGDSMVKMPRKVMRYSPYAGKHTEHTVERVKKRRASELKWGQRRFRRVTSGYRGFPRPKPSGEKPTKRVNLVYRCTETGKAHSPKGKRARKFELVDN